MNSFRYVDSDDDEIELIDLLDGRLEVGTYNAPRDSSERTVYINVAAARLLAEYLTAWADAQPEPFPFEDGDILHRRGVHGSVYLVVGGSIRYADNLNHLPVIKDFADPSLYVKVGTTRFTEC